MNRRHRLRGRAAFLAVRRRRASGSTEALRVGMAENTAGIARVGFAIPRAAGGAVVRNRIRRRLRETLRPGLAELAGLDVVVSVRPAATSLTRSALEAQLARAVASARRGIAASSARSARTP